MTAQQLSVIIASAIARLWGFGIAGAERPDGADLPAPLGGLGEAPLFLHRQLRQGVDLCALVERGADDLPQHDDLGASGLAGDSAAALAGLLGGVVDEGVGLLSLILRLSTLGLGCFGPASGVRAQVRASG